jgi:hypothetical protein
MAVDYLQVVLNGLFTGIGVIAAQKIWQVIADHSEKVKDKIKGNGW